MSMLSSTVPGLTGASSSQELGRGALRDRRGGEGCGVKGLGPPLRDISGASLKMEELPCTYWAPNLWDIKTEQNNLCTGLSSCPRELSAKVTTQQIL